MQFRVSSSILKIFTALFALVFSIQLCIAAPIRRAEVAYSRAEARDVFVPPVLLPNTNSVWTIGTTEVVSWDISSPPSQITNRNGFIVLRSEETGLLDLDNPLASGFDILNGSTEVTVPDVKPGTYRAVVFGDSGNWGEPFEIVAA